MLLPAAALAQEDDPGQGGSNGEAATGGGRRMIRPQGVNRAQLSAPATRNINPAQLRAAGALGTKEPVKPAEEVPAPVDAVKNTPNTSRSSTSNASSEASSTSKNKGDTNSLPQFESAMEYEPRRMNEKVTFSLEDADLQELVRVIGQLTGKRFIFGGKVKSVKASVYSPQKVTVAEAYQAFLSILEQNGLTVVPHGRFLKIVETPGVASMGTPTYGPGQAVPNEERYVTRMHRLRSVSADDAANVLNKFKSKDGDIVAYAPGNLLIITDTGANIRRMVGMLEQIDVGTSGDQVWVEPVHYAAASDVAARVNELFDVKGGSSGGGSSSNSGGGGKGSAGNSGSSVIGSAGSGDFHVTKVIPDDRTNSLIVVATERAYLRMLELIKRLDVPQSGEGEIHVLPLQHADAVELAKTLNEIVGNSGSSGGGGGNTGGGRRGGQAAAAGAQTSENVFEGGVRISADKATNSIVVTSSLRDYASLRAVVDRLDLPRKQVFIEAVVMDLNIRRGSDLGLSFHGGSTVTSQNEDDTLLIGGLNPQTSILNPASLASVQGAALGIRGPELPGSRNLVPGISLGIPAFGAVLTALASTGDADVLSTPHILALDNEPAEISVGENIPLQQNALGSLGSMASGTTGATGAMGMMGGMGFGMSPQRQDVGTKIKITPHLNESNEARLEVSEEISEAQAAQGQLGVVPITKRTATTKLVVKDQQTVVIGGLMRNRVARSQTKVPLLGDIPVLGALFRQTKNEMQKTNLILVLTPYIIREQDDLRRVFERKMQERQEFLDRYFVFSDTRYEPPKDYTRANGLVEDIRQAYRLSDEKRKLEELTRPRELKGHEPQTALEMPLGPSSSSNSGGVVESAGEPARIEGARPQINVQPATRNVERVER